MIGQLHGSLGGFACGDHNASAGRMAAPGQRLEESMRKQDQLLVLQQEILIVPTLLSEVAPQS